METAELASTGRRQCSVAVRPSDAVAASDGAAQEGDRRHFHVAGQTAACQTPMVEVHRLAASGTVVGAVMALESGDQKLADGDLRRAAANAAMTSSESRPLRSQHEPA